MFRSVLLVYFVSLVANTKRHFRIGGVFNSHDNVRLFGNTVDEINTELLHQLANVTLDGTAVIANNNELLTFNDFCQNILSKKVHGMLVIADETEFDSFKLVIHQSAAFGIPTFVIGIRNNLLSDKKVFPTVLRTKSPWSYQVDGWIDLLRYFGFRQFHLLHAQESDGWAFRLRVEKYLRTYETDIEKDLKVSRILTFPSSQDSYKNYLLRLLGSESRVFCLHAALKDMCLILKEAEELGLTGSGYVWIISEVALGCATIPPGALIFRQRLVTDIVGHTKDSLNFMVKVFSMLPVGIDEPPNACIFGRDPWIPGHQFFQNALKTQVSLASTGFLSFDYYGQREFSNYDVLNVNTGQGKVIVGSFLYSKATKNMTLSMNDSLIKWPGGGTRRPTGLSFSHHLKVVTALDVPFVYARHDEDNTGCRKNEAQCPMYASSGKMLHQLCCEGYSIDLLKELAVKLNFTYTLYIPEDGIFSTYDLKEMEELNGPVGKLIRKEADMAIGALVATEQRARLIDFSVAFRHQGIAVLERKLAKTSTLVSFLQPFHGSLWITVMVAVHIIALTLYLLDRFSPFGRYKLPNSDHPEEDALNLSSAIWFAWGVLLNSGIGEGTPRSFSARVLGMVWAGFAMIIVASYTANLAAFLVLDRPKPTLSGLQDPRLRNPADNFTFTTVRGSPVEHYLNHQLDLHRVYKTMGQYTVNSVDEGIQAVKDGRISAFLWDSTQLEVESAKDCDLVVSSHSLGRSGYVVGLQKKSRWTDSVNEALLDFSEDGTLLELDRKWIVSALFNSECEKPGSEPARLGLKNMAGVFILVAAGIVGGVGLIGIEILFKRHYSRQQRQIELTRHAFEKWKNMVKRRKMLRGTIENQRRSKLNGSLPNFTVPGENIDTSNADGIFVIGEGRYFDV